MQRGNQRGLLFRGKRDDIDLIFHQNNIEGGMDGKRIGRHKLFKIGCLSRIGFSKIGTDEFRR